MSKLEKIGWAVAFATFVIVIVLLSCSIASAGEIPLRWDPVTAPANCGTLGYTLHRGAASGSYGSSVDVGNVTAAPFTGLADCTMHYVAAKAYCRSGGTTMPSATYSSEVSGWPRITVASLSPSQWFAGQTVQVTATGTNLRSGLVITDSSLDVTVSSVQWASCNSLTFTVAVSSTPTLGPVTLTFSNPDATRLDVPATITAVVVPAPPAPTGFARTDAGTVPGPVDPAPGPASVTVDNVDVAAVSLAGTWTTTATQGYWYPNGGTGNASRTTVTGSTFTWSTTLAGEYAVSAYWPGTSSGEVVTYEIRDGAVLLATVQRAQTVSGQWTAASALGTFTFSSGTASVTVIKMFTGTAPAFADAVRFVRVP